MNWNDVPDEQCCPRCLLPQDSTSTDPKKRIVCKGCGADLWLLRLGAISYVLLDGPDARSAIAQLDTYLGPKNSSWDELNSIDQVEFFMVLGEARDTEDDSD